MTQAEGVFMSDNAHWTLSHALRGAEVEAAMPLFTVHAEAPGVLAYALDYIAAQPAIVHVEAEP
jgi:hypothetical protein